VKNIVEPDRP